MASSKRNPVPRAAGRASEWLSQAARTTSEDISALNIRQAERLVARFGLTPPVASVVAALHFGGARA